MEQREAAFCWAKVAGMSCLNLYHKKEAVASTAYGMTILCCFARFWEKSFCQRKR